MEDVKLESDLINMKARMRTTAETVERFGDELMGDPTPHDRAHEIGDALVLLAEDLRAAVERATR